MRDPDLSKAALITAEQILQEVCQQVLQKFNSFLNILISLDERQCIGILLLCLVSGTNVEPRNGIKPNIGKTLCPQWTVEWSLVPSTHKSGGQWQPNNSSNCPRCSVQAVKGPERAFILNNLEPLCHWRSDRKVCCCAFECVFFNLLKMRNF